MHIAIGYYTFPFFCNLIKATQNSKVNVQSFQRCILFDEEKLQIMWITQETKITFESAEL